MTYIQQTWANGATGGTPIDSDALNHMETGIANNDSAITTLQSSLVSAAGLSVPLVTKTANYTLVATDGAVLSNGTVTLTLPSAVSAGAGKIYFIRNIHASAVCTVNTNGGNIDGSSSKTLAAGVRNQFISDATNWWSIN